MKKITCVMVLLFILLGALTLPATAQSEDNQDQRDPAFEQSIYDRLEKINPEAVSIFIAATEALDNEDLETARKGYEDVLVLAPDFPDALRRLSQVYTYQNNFEEAESLARRALEALDAPENKVNLAYVLLQNESTDTNFEAFRLAQAANEEQPGEEFTLTVLAMASAATENTEILTQSSSEWVQMSPENPAAHYFYGIALAYTADWDESEKEILLARDLGLPAEYVQEMLDQVITPQARFQRAIRWGIYTLVGWIVALGLLFGIGVILSRATLVSVNRQKKKASLDASPNERFVRRLYRVIIAITSGYFYLSIPILLVIVIVLVGLVIYGFLAIGQIPIKLALITLLGGLYTLATVVRSLFIRRKQSDPGMPLEKKDAFYLRDLLNEVARAVGTRPVESVFLTAGTEIGVFERGNWWKRLRGQGERCLIFGLGALPGMNQGQLRAILAHEYGHLSHADTAGGDLANAVSFNLRNMAQGLASVGTAAWYNPVWLFINGYYRIFMRITQGASRLQEILADRCATVQYGAQNMASGLEHIIRQSLIFKQQTDSEIKQAIEEKRGLKNLYTLPVVEKDADLEVTFQEIMQQKTSPYASHPSPAERLEYIQMIPNGNRLETDPRPVWNLFPDATGIQLELTRNVEDNLRSQGALPDVS
jgi:Zn-dependent protease with chaperone function